MASRDVTLRLLIETVDNTGKVLQDLASNLKTVGDEIVKTDTLGKEVGSTLPEGLSKSTESAQELKASFDNLNNAGQEIIDKGKQLAIVGAAMSVIAGASVKAAADYQKTMIALRAEGHATDAQLKGISETVLKLAGDSEFSADEQGRALHTLIDSGIELTNAQNALIPITDLAAATQSDLGSAATATATVLKAYNLEFKDLNRVTGILTQLSNDTTKAVGELGGELSGISTYARSAGVSIEQLAAMTKALSDAGAGGLPQLRMSMMRLVDPPKQVTDAFSLMKIEIKRADDGSVDYLGTLAVLKERMGDVSKWGETMNQIFTLRGVKSATVLMNDLNKIMADSEGRFKNVNTKAKETADVYATTLTEGMEKFGNAVKALNIAMGDPLLKPINAAIGALRGLTNAMTTFSKAYPEVSGAILGIAGTIGVITAAVGSSMLIIGSVITAWKVLAATLGLTGFVSAASAAFASLGLAIGGVALTLGQFIALFAVITWTATQLFKLAQEIWGLVQANNAASESQGRLDATIKKAAATTGLNIKTWEDWNKLQKEGLITFDSATKSWVKTTEAQQAAILARKADVIETAKQTEASKASTAAANLESQAQIALRKAINEKVTPIRIEAMDDTAARLKAQREQAKLGEEQTALAIVDKGVRGMYLAAIQANWDKKEADYSLALARATADGILDIDKARIGGQQALLEWQYRRNLITVEEYLDKKNALELAALDKELKNLKGKLAGGSLSDEARISLKLDIGLKEEDIALAKATQKRVAIEIKEQAATDALALKDTLAGIQTAGINEWEYTEKARIARAALLRAQERKMIELEAKHGVGVVSDAALIAAKEAQAAELAIFDKKTKDDALQRERDFESQLTDLKLKGLNPSQTEEELSLFVDQQKIAAGNMEKIWEQAGLTMAQKQKLRAAQQISDAKALADKELEILQDKLSSASYIASGMSALFSELYDASGKKIIAFFYLEKAAAMADAAIKGAQAVLAFMATPGGYIGMAMSVVAASLAGVQMGIIAAQQPPQNRALGGLVEGGSGHRDDVPLLGMGGEFMIRQAAVRKYGINFMEALNHGMIDLPAVYARSISQGMASAQRGYANGGLIKPAADQDPGKGNTEKVSNEEKNLQIINVIDPSVMDKYMTSNQGQKTIINVMAANRYELQKIMR